MPVGRLQCPYAGSTYAQFSTDARHHDKDRNLVLTCAPRATAALLLPYHPPPAQYQPLQSSMTAQYCIA
eukprot:870363-Rhodomonas_salina.3